MNRRGRQRDDGTSPFERWRLELPAGTEYRTEASDWAGALVRVERGLVEVECVAGACRTFVAGSLLALAWLPLRALRNPGRETTCLLAVRRRRPSAGRPADGRPPSPLRCRP